MKLAQDADSGVLDRAVESRSSSDEGGNFQCHTRLVTTRCRVRRERGLLCSQVIRIDSYINRSILLQFFDQRRRE